MGEVGQTIETAAVFGASGGIGGAIVDTLVGRGVKAIHAGSRAGKRAGTETVRPFRFALEDEETIAEFAQNVSNDPPDFVFVATGVLTLPDGTGPEKSLGAMNAAGMRHSFMLNTIGPALIAKHLLPVMSRDRRTVFAALSARVGSIGDNRLGGWHSYRASKAALNMLIRNFAIEQARTHPSAIIVALHPGTVNTELSAPFQKNVSESQLFKPKRSAEALLDVVSDLGPADSGGHFDWQGKRVPA